MTMPLQRASFALDMPILLPLCGYLSARIAEWRGVRPRLLMAATLAGFWIVAGGLYLDVFNCPFLGDIGRGNHFMWNSGVELLGLKPLFVFSRPTYERFYSLANLTALAFFLIFYPLAFYLGFKRGERR